MLDQIYKLAHRIFPHSPFWPRRIGLVHLRAMGSHRSEAERRKEAVSALSALELAEELRYRRASKRARGSRRSLEELEHLSKLGRLIAPVALEAGDLSKAEKYARDLLFASESARGAGISHSQPWSEASHEAHVVLSRAALARGDFSVAEHHLREAIERIPSSHVYGFSGPDAGLLQALVDTGRTDAALTYLRACRTAWTWGRRQLDEWEDQITRGMKPDFFRRVYRAPRFAGFVRLRPRPQSKIPAMAYRLRAVAFLVGVVGLFVNRKVALAAFAVWVVLVVFSSVMARLDEARRHADGSS